MSDLSYAPLIREMTWSYSRIKTFETCPHAWFLTYIKNYSQKDRFFTSYGSFMHSLLEAYFSGKLSRGETLTRFLTGFRENVRGERPSAELAARYVVEGSSYLSGLQKPDGEICAVEEAVSFDIGGRPFVGVIDLRLRENGSLVVIDHKSRDLKPRSGRTKPTVSDRELDDRLRQLYLYAAAVQQKYGELPSELRFNCFRTGAVIRERFERTAFDEAQAWALRMIGEIENEEDFEPKQEYYYCRWICPVADHCDYDLGRT